MGCERIREGRDLNFSVTGIYRYPVKSMQGEALDRVVVGPGGLALDRGWALRDEENGNILSAKRVGELLECSARYVDHRNDISIPHVEISLPGGKTIRSDDPGANNSLSEFLDRDVTLWPLQPKEDAEHYRIRRDPDFDLEQELREMFALNPDEGLPDLGKFPPEVLEELSVYSSPRGTYFDAFPMNFLTEASLRRMAQLMPGVKVGRERFRPNILVGDDQQCCDMVEFDWVGKKVSVGGAQFDIAMECPRCVMTTRAQPGYEKASSIMRTLVRELNHNLSVYANVARGGLISLGDAVEVISELR
jgi:uncharacterized protein